MFCKNCNNQINESSKFCKFCGVKVADRNPSQVQYVQQNSRRFDFSKLIFNKFTLIVAGVIFIVWISDTGSYSSSSGSKAPLPPPIVQQTQQESVIDISALDVSLTNGTVLKQNDYYLSGDGTLEISNGTKLDAVAKLVRNGTSVYTVYIKANNKFTISNISNGVYWLIFAQGSDWNFLTKKFNKNQQYSAFEETFDFETTEDDLYYYNSAFEVTLNPVVGGTAETESVDPEQFSQY
ncbi:MAG: hypothetical protein KAS07_03590 [Candidatus Pacebacteria bacterium]|nr:hypothetical protein [Candidatus Paceibacterota bacterium]